MSDVSAIEWTEATLNPWTGCTKVDPACAHCYIEHTPPFRMKGRKFVRGDIPIEFHLDRLDKMLRRRKPTMYFVNSLSDVFHEDVPDEVIALLFTAMRRAEQHTFQCLTKRHERMRDLMRRLAWRSPTSDERDDASRPAWRRTGPQAYFTETLDGGLGSYVCPNIWLGVTIGNRRFVHRADFLRQAPAAVRFISAEPLLGPLVPLSFDADAAGWSCTHPPLDLTGIDWLIVGGESGPKHRPIRAEWVRDLRDACIREGLAREDRSLAARMPDARPGPAFFFKQWGGRTPKAGGRELDGRTWDEMPRAQLSVGAPA